MTEIRDLIETGRQQRAVARSAEETRLKLEAGQRTQQHQALMDALCSIVTAQLPPALHPYWDWDTVSLDEWTNEIQIDIDVPECALITVTFVRHGNEWTWNGNYRVLVPDHVEYDYEDGYQIHYDRQFETEVTLALAAAADAYPRLQQLQAERKTLEAGRLDRMHEEEARIDEETEKEESQREALLRILQADPVLRAFFHAVVAYRNAQASWDTQLGQQYADMLALEQRYRVDLDRARQDADEAHIDAAEMRTRVTELERAARG